MKTLGKVTILLMVSFVTPLQALELSREQWRSLFEKKIEVVIRGHYLYLSKNFTDAALMVSRGVQYDAIHTQASYSRLQKLIADLAGDSKRRAASLREIVVLRAQMKYLGQQIQFEAEQWEQLKQIRAGQCRANEVERFAQDFSTSAVLAVRATLSQIKDQLEKMTAEGGGVAISVQYSIPLEGGAHQWQINQQSSGGSGVTETMGICTGIGGGIGIGVGSLLGPVGSAVGGAIGSFVGGVIGEIFDETPLAKWTRIFREQSDSIVGAATELGQRGARESVAKSCQEFIERDSLLSLYDRVDASVRESMAMAQARISDFDREYDLASQRYTEQLKGLVEETLPILRDSIDSMFEKYFENLAALSKESKDYVRERVVPPLTVLLQGNEELPELIEARERLWTSLIEGDAHFSPPLGSGDRELIYWDPASATILRQLKERSR